MADLQGHLTASHGQVVKRQEALRHALRGKSSEKLPEKARQLAFEDLEVAIAQTETMQTANTTPSGTRRGDGENKKPAQRNLGHLPRDLPRIEQVIEPESTECPCGCGQMHRIGEDRSERLDIIPAQVRVIVTVRPKYACRSCAEGVTQAAAPARIVEGGLPSEGAIAHVLIAKYADFLPQGRVLMRSGLDIHRSTLAGWVGKAAFHLAPVVDRLADHLKTSSKLFMDETTAPVLDPGRGQTKTGYPWALARDDRAWAGKEPPGVVFHYAPGRGGKHAERLLDGFDGYTGYNRLARPTRKGGKPVRFAFCWAHSCRKLREIFDSGGSPIAAEGLHRIAELYAIEKKIRAHAAEMRLAVRKARSAPLVTEFGNSASASRQSPASARSLAKSPATLTQCRSSSRTAASKCTPTMSRI